MSYLFLLLSHQGVVLGKFLELHPSFVQGRRVLELGSGTGVVGLVAACLGARHVTLTDYPNHRVMKLLEANVRSNAHVCEPCSVEAAPLAWGWVHESPTMASLLGVREGESEKEEEKKKGDGFDMILCSDLIYDKPRTQLLLATLRELSRSEENMNISRSSSSSCKQQEASSCEEKESKSHCTEQSHCSILMSYRVRNTGATDPVPEQMAMLAEYFDIRAVPESEYHPVFRSPDIQIVTLTPA